MGILSSLYSGVSGLAANGNALSVIGNNISNGNTIGFKAGRSVFSDLLSSTVASTSGGSQIGRGVGVSTVDNLFTQGTFENTSQDTDLAIEGKGFFIVRDPSDNSIFYTRAGAFRWNSQGFLTSPEGFRVMGYALNDQGNVSGDLTELQVDTTTLSPPEATTAVTFTTNLDAAAPYTNAIIGSFVGVGRTVSGVATDFTDPAAAPLTVNGYPLSTIAGGGTYNQGSAKEIAEAINLTPGISSVATILPGSTNMGETSQVMSASNWTINPGALTINGVDMAGVIAGNDDRALYDANVENFFNAKLNAVGVQASIDPNTHALELSSIDGSNIQIQSTVNLSTRVVGFNGALTTTTFSGVKIVADGIDVGKVTIDTGTDSTSGIIFNTGTSGRDAGFDVTNAENTSNYANSVTIYDSLGNPHQVTVYFTKLNPVTNPLEWEYDVTVDAAELNLVPAQTGPYVIAKGTLTFLEDGTLDPSLPSGLTTVPGTISWNNNSDPSIQLDIDFNTTQWANASVVISQTQNGFGTGSVAQLSIDNDGNVLGNFSNGVPRELYRIALASFANISGLEKAGNNMYVNTGDSGAPIVGTVGSGIGKIFTNSLEQSNVDLAAEFVSMITTQRGFQANSKIITTTDEMLNELINLKR